MIKNGLLLSFAGAVLLLAGPLGYNVGMWPFIIAILMMGLSLVSALVGASLSLVAGIKTGRWPLATVGIVVGLAVVSIPSAVIVPARDKPVIYDISTGSDNPPAFVAVQGFAPCCSSSCARSMAS